MPLSYCLEVEDASPPVDGDVACAYWDGTIVETGPSTGTCAISPHSAWQYCAGDCDACAFDHYCVGVSEARSFGVCINLRVPFAACERDASEANGTGLGFCELAAGEPCVCLSTEPWPDGRPEYGVIVPATVCRDYAMHQPGVECLDAFWEPFSL